MFDRHWFNLQKDRHRLWAVRSHLTSYVIALAMLLATACQLHRSPSLEIVTPDGKPRARVYLEIADTGPKRELGLMYRKELGADQGMLFLFPHMDRLTFWMKNTEIPLDMIFADQNLRVVGIIANAQPFSEAYLTIGEPSQYVLEVNGGWSKAHGIRSGDSFVLHGVSPDRGR